MLKLKVLISIFILSFSNFALSANKTSNFKATIKINEFCKLSVEDLSF